jgi:hypothetical protein
MTKSEPTESWITFFTQAKSLIVLVPTITGLLTVVWTAYAQPAVKEIAKKEVEPVTVAVKENASNIETIKFTMSQILLILEKTTDLSIIAEVKKETERFKPKEDNK